MTKPRSLLLATLMLGPILIALALALFLSRPPAAKPLNAPAEQFSAQRAMKHVREIAQKPHPWGSEENERVKAYITGQVRLLEMEPHESEDPPHRHPERGLPLENIVVRMGGSTSTGAVLLMAHYDTVDDAPGAGDNTAGVATLLETMRALTHRATFPNDVIFLFTDAEEKGLFGAKAFLGAVEGPGTSTRHPYADDVRVVLNFDGIGTSGPVLLADTGEQNGWLIAQLAAAVSYPLANSLMYDVQKRLPSRSDLLPFRRAGHPGMNINFIGAYQRNHSPLDVPAALNLGTLQHLGEYALPLAERFASVPLDNVESPPAVYFNPAGYLFVHYPASYNGPLAFLALAAFAGLVLLGNKRGRLTLKGSLAACGLYLLQIVVLCLFSSLSGAALAHVQGELFHWVPTLHLAGATLASTAIYLWLAVPFQKCFRDDELAVGPLAVWQALLLVITALFPGGSPLFLWPFLAAASALAFHFAWDKEGEIGRASTVRFSLAAAIAVLVFTANIIALHLGVLPHGGHLLGLSQLFVAFALGIMAPQMLGCVRLNRWLLPTLLLGTALLIHAASIPIAVHRYNRAQTQAYEAQQASAPRAAAPPGRFPATD